MPTDTPTNRLFNAYAAQKAKGELSAFSYEPKPLGPKDIEIDITHCGVCHSDAHLVDNDWGFSEYPLVPGHEIIGTVRVRGDEVTHLNVGDRVGVGWQRQACLSCEDCLRGDDQLCVHSEATCVGHFGGFSNKIRVNGSFAFKIPEALASEQTAPLLCGGITVYSPLKYFNVKPHHRVGVIGIGGLGHLAIQFASKMGCEVTALSTQADKEKEAKTFGAHEFICTKESKVLENHTRKFDFILNTAHANLNWQQYLSTLKSNGKLCFVGVPSEPLEIPVFSLLAGRKTVCASPIGSRSVIIEMLDFAALHKIGAQTESLTLDHAHVNEALEKVRNNQARYRMVLKT